MALRSKHPRSRMTLEIKDDLDSALKKIRRDTMAWEDLQAL
jgi:hypothetical protein